IEAAKAAGVGPGSGAIAVAAWDCCSKRVGSGFSLAQAPSRVTLPPAQVGSVTFGFRARPLRGQRHQHRPSILDPDAGDGPGPSACPWRREFLHWFSAGEAQEFRRGHKSQSSRAGRSSDGIEEGKGSALARNKNLSLLPVE